MNVKESHIVTGMSRDSSVSRQNPNLVYDAHNIRITTKDGKNSLMAVTNERGTRRMTVSGDTIVGTPIGDAVIDKSIVLFTHDDYYTQASEKDHIYRCEIRDNIMTVTKVFEGDANFSLENPIETLPVYETESIQKVYWTDGRNQPRCLNVSPENPELIDTSVTPNVPRAITDSNMLEFSPTVALNQNMYVTKNTTGGEFPVGTIQYAFSYYKVSGQETRLIDISPMYYLSPIDKGLDATSMSNASFNIVITDVDVSFDKVRVYSIVRTQENEVPICRIVGDFDIQRMGVLYGINIVDNGVGGRIIEATSLYFIGGERLVAGTLAQKDNTLFLGNIKLTMPNLSEVKSVMTEHPVTPTAITIGYKSKNTYTDTPIKSFEYYGYEPDNNRSSYFIKAFKFRERYKLGFIAQYENGQWSEPLSLSIVQNTIKPEATQAIYKRGGFSATLNTYILEELRRLGFKRVAPVVVYPRNVGRRTLVQGILCPTVATYGDRESNSPFAQSSWFFRFNTNIAIVDKDPLEGNDSGLGEIQCMDKNALNNNAVPSGQILPVGVTPNYNSNGSKYPNWFFYNTRLSTLHSPDIECTEDNVKNIDFTGTQLIKVGSAYLDWYRGTTVVDHFLETENIGINTEKSQVIKINRTAGAYEQKSFCLYGDSAVDHTNNDEVVIHDKRYMLGWVVYPWHRNGSLNNQAALSTKQKSSGFTSRTAMLKKNITARAHFANIIYDAGNPSAINMNSCTPKVFNSDQLSGISLSSKVNEGGVITYYSHIYYGNIDKIIVPDNGYYYARHGWSAKDDDDSYTVSERSQGASGGWSHLDMLSDLGYDQHKVSDPISMKYKSTPHIVIDSSNITFSDNTCGYSGTWPNYTPLDHRGGLFIMELMRDVTDAVKFGEASDITPDAWIRCGESVEIPNSGTADLDYLQGDCYFQMYDCLKTYPFTLEDTNSVIEIFSVMLETYVNLDFKYDKNRGASNNVAIGPTNFNLLNEPAYNQTGNFFSYHQLDYSLIKNRKFPNTITWSLEKHSSENVDNWMSIDVSNTTELDGAFGKVNKLINYNNDIYCFQDIGISKLLFNSRVQIPTSDNTPIEITNGMKMDGKMYISTKIGCTNKWSIIETPMGLYFNDDIMKSTYLFNGQLADLSSAKGMKSWMNDRCRQEVWNSRDFGNCRAFYDKIGRDIYWIYDDTALVYSEILGQYMSFMDYGNVPLLESLGNSTYAVTNNYSKKTTAEVKAPFRAGEVVVDTGKFTFTLNANHTKTVNFQVEWKVGTTPRNPRPAAEVYTDTSGTDDKVYVTIYTCAYYSADLYTLGDVLTAIQNSLPAFLTASLNVVGTNSLAYRNAENYENVSTYLTNSESSPFWELGKGEYNMFFGRHKPYWLTFISNSYPTENKIFNNVAWRDIVTDAGTPEPFHTFDHIRVWTENQDTRSVRFSNSLSENPSRQPISYDAAISNLRKKFNVWRCQIPRDKIATNTARARISNPWCYIKLSREDFHTERHEIMDFEVDYFM